MEKITAALHNMINHMKRPSFLLLLGLINLFLIVCMFRCVKRIMHGDMGRGMMYGHSMKYSKHDMYDRGGRNGGRDR